MTNQHVPFECRQEQVVTASCFLFSMRYSVCIVAYAPSSSGYVLICDDLGLNVVHKAESILWWRLKSRSLHWLRRDDQRYTRLWVLLDIFSHYLAMWSCFKCIRGWSCDLFTSDHLMRICVYRTLYMQSITLVLPYTSCVRSALLITIMVIVSYSLLELVQIICWWHFWMKLACICLMTIIARLIWHRHAIGSLRTIHIVILVISILLIALDDLVVFTHIRHVATES